MISNDMIATIKGSSKLTHTTRKGAYLGSNPRTLLLTMLSSANLSMWCSPCRFSNRNPVRSYTSRARMFLVSVTCQSGAYRPLPKMGKRAQARHTRGRSLVTGATTSPPSTRNTPARWNTQQHQSLETCV
jgi:hypothetical protein